MEMHNMGVNMLGFIWITFLKPELVTLIDNPESQIDEAVINGVDLIIKAIKAEYG